MSEIEARMNPTQVERDLLRVTELQMVGSPRERTFRLDEVLRMAEDSFTDGLRALLTDSEHQDLHQVDLILGFERRVLDTIRIVQGRVRQTDDEEFAQLVTSASNHVSLLIKALDVLTEIDLEVLADVLPGAAAPDTANREEI